MNSRRALGVLVAALLCAPALAGAAVITNGIDTWTTPGDGSSYIDFADDPIPAGFFCIGSEPFMGRVHWVGVPLASEPEGALGAADTIVQRLDNVVLGPEGRGTTRLQVRAVVLTSLEPIHTNCGSFDLTASLRAGPQPLTTMEIFEDRPGSGTFDATLAMNVKLTFEKVRGLSSRPLVLDRFVELQTQGAPWSSDAPEDLEGQVGGFVLIDTDGDERADTFLPGQSNFHPLGGNAPHQIATCEGPGGTTCHTIGGSECHCATP